MRKARAGRSRRGSFSGVEPPAWAKSGGEDPGADDQRGGDAADRATSAKSLRAEALMDAVAPARASSRCATWSSSRALLASRKPWSLRCGAESSEGRWEQNGEVLSRRSVARAPNDDVLELAHWMASVLIGIGVGADVDRASDDPVARLSAKSSQIGPGLGCSRRSSWRYCETRQIHLGASGVGMPLWRHGRNRGTRNFRPAYKSAERGPGSASLRPVCAPSFSPPTLGVPS